MSLRPAFVISHPLVPIFKWERSRARFRQRLAAALRSGSVPKIVSAPALHFLRPPTANRSGFQNQFSAILELLNQSSAVTAYAARQHRIRSAMKPAAIVWRRRKCQ
jgi:hypothetical protein